MPTERINGRPVEQVVIAGGSVRVSDGSGPLTVDGPLTNAELRASRVPVDAAPAAAVATNYSQAGVIAINTVLMTLDLSQSRAVSIQCTSMGASGVVTVEWSADNANWVTATVSTPAGATVTTINAVGIWSAPAYARYFRLRMSTATTSGTTAFVVHQFDAGIQMWLATQPVTGTVTANIGTGSIAAGTNAIGDVGLQYRASNAGAASVSAVSSAATPTAVTVKGSAGRVIGMELHNNSASLRYLKLFNVVTPTLGTTSAAYEVVLPPTSRTSFNYPGGIGHSTAIVHSITSAPGLTNNTATGLVAGDVIGFIVFA